MMEHSVEFVRNYRRIGFILCITIFALSVLKAGMAIWGFLDGHFDPLSGTLHGTLALVMIPVGFRLDRYLASYYPQPKPAAVKQQQAVVAQGTPRVIQVKPPERQQQVQGERHFSKQEKRQIRLARLGFELDQARSKGDQETVNRLTEVLAREREYENRRSIQQMVPSNNGVAVHA